MKVRFSILVPTYNRRDLVRETIDSVLCQTFPDFELFLTDDGSTDGTIDLLRAYGSPIKVLQQRNRGPEVARNAAAAQAHGEYLVMLDSDDLLFPVALEVYDQVIRAFDPAVVLGSVFRFHDGQPLPRETETTGQIAALKFRDYASKTVPLPACISMIVLKKAVFDAVGGMRNSTPLNFHNDDFNLLLKTSTYGPCIAVQRPYTVAYRLHGENSVRNIRLIAEGLLNTARTERRGEYPGGASRLWDRYATIGGQTASWACSYCWPAGERKLALRLLCKTWPMVAAAMGRKLMRRVQPPPEVLRLPGIVSAEPRKNARQLSATAGTGAGPTSNL
jgi:glycosyltransferase involved in cell wall biosynthesis